MPPVSTARYPLLQFKIVARRKKQEEKNNKKRKLKKTKTMSDRNNDLRTVISRFKDASKCNDYYTITIF